MKNDNKHPVRFYLDDEYKQKLDELAEKLASTPGRVVKHTLKQILDNLQENQK